MRAALALIMLTFLLTAANAADVQDALRAADARRAKDSLEALQKRLPAVLKTWCSQQKSPLELTSELRRVRALGHNEVKLTVYLWVTDSNGRRLPNTESIMAIYLKYHDGLWTAVRCDWAANDEAARNSVAFLLDAIDETAEK